MEDSNSFNIIAQYYDEAYSAKLDLQDVEMFITFANRFGGPILEIGCGTGRVLLPIAKLGIDIDGIDISEPMLSVLRSKSNKLNLNLNVHQKDMRSFQSN